MEEAFVVEKTTACLTSCVSDILDASYDNYVTVFTRVIQCFQNGLNTGAGVDELLGLLHSVVADIDFTARSRKQIVTPANLFQRIGEFLCISPEISPSDQPRADEFTADENRVTQEAQVKACLGSALLYFWLNAHKQLMNETWSAFDVGNVQHLSDDHRGNFIDTDKSAASDAAEVLLARQIPSLYEGLEKLMDTMVRTVNILVSRKTRLTLGTLKSLDHVTLECLGSLLCEVTEWIATITAAGGAAVRGATAQQGSPCISGPRHPNRRGLRRSLDALVQLLHLLFRNAPITSSSHLFRSFTHLVLSPSFPAPALRGCTQLVDFLWTSLFSGAVDPQTQHALALLLCNFGLLKGAQLDPATRSSQGTDSNAATESAWEGLTRCALDEAHTGLQYVILSSESSPSAPLDKNQRFTVQRVRSSLTLLKNLCHFFGGSGIVEGLGGMKLPQTAICGPFPVDRLLHLVLEIVSHVVSRLRHYVLSRCSLLYLCKSELAGLLHDFVHVRDRLALEEVLLHDAVALLRAVLDRASQGALLLRLPLLKKLLETFFGPLSGTVAEHSKDTVAVAIRWVAQLRYSQQISDILNAVVTKVPCLLDRPERLNILLSSLESQLRFVSNPHGIAPQLSRSLAESAVNPSLQALHNNATDFPDARPGATLTSVDALHFLSALTHRVSGPISRPAGPTTADPPRGHSRPAHAQERPETRPDSVASFLLAPSLHIVSTITLLQQAFPSSNAVVDCSVRAGIDEAALRLLWRLAIFSPPQQAAAAISIWDTPAFSPVSGTDLRLAMASALLSLVEQSLLGPSAVPSPLLRHVAISVVRRIDQIRPCFLYPLGKKGICEEYHVRLSQQVAQLLSQLKCRLVSKPAPCLPYAEAERIKHYNEAFRTAQAPYVESQQKADNSELSLSNRTTPTYAEATLKDDRLPSPQPPCAEEVSRYLQDSVPIKSDGYSSFDKQEPLLRHDAAMMINEEMNDDRGHEQPASHPREDTLSSPRPPSFATPLNHAANDSDVEIELHPPAQHHQFSEHDQALQLPAQDDQVVVDVLVEPIPPGLTSASFPTDGTVTAEDAASYNPTPSSAEAIEEVLTPASAPSNIRSLPQMETTINSDDTADPQTTNDLPLNDVLLRSQNHASGDLVTPPRRPMSDDEDDTTDPERSSLTLLQNYDEDEEGNTDFHVDNQCEVSSCLRYCGFRTSPEPKSSSHSVPQASHSPTPAQTPVSVALPDTMTHQHTEPRAPSTGVPLIPGVLVSDPFKNNDDDFLNSIGL